MPARLTVIGSTNLDLTIRSPRLPLPGETVTGSSFHRHFGGKGANQAVAAARLGAQVHFIGKVGGDAFGEDAREQLVKESVDVTHLYRASDASTGTAVILVDDAGQNSIVVVPGANGELTPQEVKVAAEAIQGSQYLVAQLEVPIPAVLEAFRIANAGHVITILNPAPASEIPDELLKRSEICTPNEIELARLTGLPVGTIDEVEAAARALRKRGAREIVATLGERGIFMLDGFGAKHFPAPQVTPVDTSGAGDAFTGALAVFLAEGCPIREAARRAQHAAALSVTRAGTQSSFPTRAELLA
jgi:ribokinase